MPKPKFRSKSLRKVFVRVPSGRTVVHYKKRKPKVGHCSICKKPMMGVARLRDNKIKKIAKTKKRVERPYPNLCSSCMRKIIIMGARKDD